MNSIDTRLVEIFDAVQRAKLSEDKALEKLSAIYKTVCGNESSENVEENSAVNEFVFANGVKRCVVPTFEVGERSFPVERVLKLYASFVASTLHVHSNYLDQHFLPLVEEFYDDARKSYRLRVTHLVYLLMLKLSNEELEISDEVFCALRKVLLKRSRDRFGAVRVVAVKALVFFQAQHDPDSTALTDSEENQASEKNLENDPVVKAFNYILMADQNAEVRKAVLETMWVNTQTLFARLLRHCRDLSPACRAVAFTAIGEKLSVRALSLQQRLDLLTVGFQNENKSVVEALSKMIRSWLTQVEGQVKDFLLLLDVVTEPELCQKALTNIFSSASPQEIKASFDILDERKLLPDEHCTVENVFIWRCMLSRLKTFGHTDLFESLSPSVTQFAQFLAHHLKRMGDVDVEDELICRTFIAEQLITIAQCLDLSMDEAGRKALVRVLEANLKDSSCSDYARLVKTQMELLLGLIGKHNFVSSALGIISDLKCPLEDEPPTNQLSLNEEAPAGEGAGENLDVSSASTATTIDGQGVDLNESQMRELQFKLGQATVRVHEQRALMDSFVARQEFMQAAEVKEKIAQLEKEKELLQQQVNKAMGLSDKQKRPLNSEGPSDSGEGAEAMDVQDAANAEPVLSEAQERNDPNTIFKCLTIMHRIPQMVFFKQMPANLVELRNELIKQLATPYDHIRVKVAQCIGVYAMFDREYAVQMLPMVVQLILVDKKESVQLTALRVLLDLTLRYGLSVVDSHDSDDEDEAGPEALGTLNMTSLNDTFLNQSAIAASGSGLELLENDDSSPGSVKLIKLLVRYLENASAEMRCVAAEGLAKLLLHDRISSPDILCRLCLLWFSPTSKNESYLRQCLGQFFPLFAFSSKEHQECVEKAMLPMLRTIFNAPLTSPLARIDCDMVVRYLSALTSPHQNLDTAVNPAVTAQNNKVIQDAHVHEKLAKKICKEILESSFDGSVPVLVKSLTYFHVSPKSTILPPVEYHDLLTQMEQSVDSGPVLKMITKLKSKVTMDVANVSANTTEMSQASEGGFSDIVNAGNPNRFLPDSSRSDLNSTIDRSGFSVPEVSQPLPSRPSVILEEQNSMNSSTLSESAVDVENETPRPRRSSRRSKPEKDAPDNTPEPTKKSDRTRPKRGARTKKN